MAVLSDLVVRGLLHQRHAGPVAKPAQNLHGHQLPRTVANGELKHCVQQVLRLRVHTLSAMNMELRLAFGSNRGLR